MAPTTYGRATHVDFPVGLISSSLLTLTFWVPGSFQFNPISPSSLFWSPFHSALYENSLHDLGTKDSPLVRGPISEAPAEDTVSLGQMLTPPPQGPVTLDCNVNGYIYRALEVRMAVLC